MQDLRGTSVTPEVERAFEAWLYSQEGKKLACAPPPKRGEVGRVLEIPIIASGNKVTIYKVFRAWHPFREGRGRWDVTLSTSEALEWCSASLWLAADAAKPVIPVPEYTDPVAPIPPIVEFQYGICPFTGDPLVKYGVLRAQTGGINRWHWYLEEVWKDARNDAEYEMQESISMLEQLRQSIAARAEHEALMQEAGVTSRQWKPFLLLRLPGMEDDLNQLLAMNPYAPTRKLDPESDDVRTYDSHLRMALEQTKTAYDHAHENHVRFVRENRVVDRLRAALKTITVCPLCQEQLGFSDDWLYAIALAGSDNLHGDCWGDEQNPYLRSIPETVVEGVKLAVTCVVSDGDARILTIGGIGVSKVVVHFEALCASDLNSLTCRDIVHEHTEASKKRKAEMAEIGVQEGTILLLRFRYDHQRNRWSTKRFVDGKTVVYSVDSRSMRAVVANVEYYCRIVGTPPSAQRPDFELVIVDPYLEKR